MFEKLFKEPTAVARHRTAPFAQEREKFLTHLAHQGYTLKTLDPIASRLLRLARVLPSSSDPLGLEELRALTIRSLRLQHRPTRCADTRNFRKKFFRTARQWLRFMGRWRMPPLPTGPLWDLRKDFMTWMDRERGLSAMTLRDRWFTVVPFIRWWELCHRPLSTLKARDLDDFVASLQSRHLSRVSLNVYLAGTRAFLRHAERRGLLPPFIADALRGPRLYSHEGLALGPSRPDVERLIAGLDTARPVDVRDRAILLLFALYGFRAGEVSRLCLEDVDWDNDTLTVNRSKRGGQQTTPLLPIVGRAILRYLQNVRPATQQRELFLKLCSPVGPMSSGALYGVVRNRFARANITSLRRGPHTLRHACASHLLSEGLSLHAVAGHLGHHGMQQVRVYAKVDLSALRDVAVFDVGEVL